MTFWTPTVILQVLIQPHFRGMPLKHFRCFQKLNPPRYNIFTLNSD